MSSVGADSNFQNCRHSRAVPRGGPGDGAVVTVSLETPGIASAAASAASVATCGRGTRPVRLDISSRRTRSLGVAIATSRLRPWRPNETTRLRLANADGMSARTSDGAVASWSVPAGGHPLWRDRASSSLASLMRPSLTSQVPSRSPWRLHASKPLRKPSGDRTPISIRISPSRFATGTLRALV